MFVPNSRPEIQTSSLLVKVWWNCK